MVWNEFIGLTVGTSTGLLGSLVSLPSGMPI
jgi:hypothetical protein